jgi:ArsR family transcriptional regulator
MDTLKNITKSLKALADENRIRIMNLLYTKEDLCVCEIREVIGLSQPTVSSHLKLLERSDLVAYGKDGKWVNYRINKDLNIKIRRILDSIFEVIKIYEKIKKDERKKLCRS